jgi:hypothetical protein
MAALVNVLMVVKMDAKELVKILVAALVKMVAAVDVMEAAVVVIKDAQVVLELVRMDVNPDAWMAAKENVQIAVMFNVLMKL